MQIRLNEWYNIGQVFPHDLEVQVDQLNRLSGTRRKIVNLRTLQPTTPVHKSKFNGSDISLDLIKMFDWSDELSEYVLPFGPPQTKDGAGYGELGFVVENPRRIDIMTSNVEEKEDKWFLEEPYRYRMNLRANGTEYVSNGRVCMPVDGSDLFAAFGRWRDINTQQEGILCAPLDIQKLSPIEIMLGHGVIDLKPMRPSALYASRKALPAGKYRT